MKIRNFIDDAIKVIKDTVNPSKEEKIDLKQLVYNEIEEHDSIIIARHVRPDGDCIGSAFGLREVLTASFPNKKIYCVGDGVPEYLSYLGEEDNVNDELYSESLVIVVDTATENRIACEKYKEAKKDPRKKAGMKLFAGPWWQWIIGAASLAAGASSGVAAGQQIKYAGDIGNEIEARKMTQDLNVDTNEIYIEEVDNFSASLMNVESLELEVPEAVSTEELVLNENTTQNKEKVDKEEEKLKKDDENKKQ